MIHPSYPSPYFFCYPRPVERLPISYLALNLVSIPVSGVSYPSPPSPHTHTPFTSLWICFSAFIRHDLYRVLVLRPGFAGCLFTTIPPSCNIHKHLLGLVTGLVSLCCLLSFSWVGVMLALFLHHEFVYRLTCRPLGVVSNILLICFASIPAVLLL